MKTFSAGKKIYQIHKWSGLIAGLFISLLGLTGSILVFHEEFEEAEYKEYRFPNNNLPVSIDNSYKSIAAQYKNWDIRVKQFSDDPTKALVFNLRKPSQRITLFLHPSTGKILAEKNTEKSFIFWILKLHYSLHAKVAGEIMVLVFGVIFLISLITGCIVYRKALFDVFLFRTRFRFTNKRSTASLLHRYIGTWALLLNLVIVFTGVVISYNIVSNAISKPVKQEITTPAISFSFDRMLKDLKKEHPQFKPNYIRFPTETTKPLLVNGTSSDLPFYYSKNYNSISVDVSTGKLLNAKLGTGKKMSEKFLAIVKGIHFLEFANLPLKLIFMLAALSAPLLSITGFLLWYFKSTKKKPQRITRINTNQSISIS